MILRKFLKYTAVADRMFIDCILNLGKRIPEAEAMLSHILNAQHIWSSRIESLQPEYERFEVHSTDIFIAMHEKNIARLEAILAEKNPEEVISFTTSAGQPMQNRIEDVLLHVANHSTYHRGQLASILKKNGIEPPVTDLVALTKRGLL